MYAASRQTQREKQSKPPAIGCASSSAIMTPFKEPANNRPRDSHGFGKLQGLETYPHVSARLEIFSGLTNPTICHGGEISAFQSTCFDHEKDLRTGPHHCALAPTGWLDQWDLMTRHQQLFVWKCPEGIFTANVYEPQPGDVCGTGDMPTLMSSCILCYNHIIYSSHVHDTNHLIQGDSQPSRP